VLKSAEAINNLVLNRGDVEGKLQDINGWAQENKISPHTYSALRTSYTQYADHMNNVFEHLAAELRSIKRFKRIKKIRLDRMIEEYSDVYSVDLQYANQIYNESFLPTYTIAAKEADTKGFFTSIILILKFGEALYTTLADLITNGKLGRKAEAKIIAYGAEVAISELKKKLYYPPWEDVVPNSGNGSSAKAESNIGSTTRFVTTGETKINRAPYYREVDGNVSLSVYGSDVTIPLVLTSKEVEVGTDASKDGSIPQFATASSLKNGDKFWVKITGYEFVKFYYYSDNSGYWKSPFGKEITARKNKDRIDGSTVYLPGKSSFFDISGANAYEEFLILVSNGPIPEERTNVIIGLESRGTLFLEKLAKILGNVQTPWNKDIEAKPVGTFDAIPIQQSAKQQSYIPIYIRIDKN